jgi:hypothetical protein
MYKLPDLPKNIDCLPVFSTVDDGNLSFVWGEKDAVLVNRKKFFNACDIKMSDCVAMGCEHEDWIVVVGNDDKGKGLNGLADAISADALITSERGLFLVLLIADCHPVIIVDPIKKVLALLHCSWKTTELKLVAKTVNKMQSEFGCIPTSMYALVGPGIKQESYIFADPQQKRLPGWEKFIADLPNNLTGIDVFSYIKYQLADNGIKQDNIFTSLIDTCKDERFFSHYRDTHVIKQPDQGRFICVVGLN